MPSIVPSASENGSDAEKPQQQFLRQPSQRLETSVETVQGQQCQLSAADHQVGQGEPEQALEEPGESVHGRARSPCTRRQGTRPKRGQRDAGERRERKTTTGGLLQPDGGRGRKIATLAHGRLLTTLDDRALGLTMAGGGRGNRKSSTAHIYIYIVGNGIHNIVMFIILCVPPVPHVFRCFFQYRCILFYILFYLTLAPSRYIYTCTISRTVFCTGFKSHNRTNTHHMHTNIIRTQSHKQHYKSLNIIFYVHYTTNILYHIITLVIFMHHY